MADDTAKSVLTELRQLAKESKQEPVQKEEDVSPMDQVSKILKTKGGMA